MLRSFNGNRRRVPAHATEGGMPHSGDRTTGRLRAPALALAAAAIAAIAGSGDVRADRPRIYALTGGKIVVSPGHVIESGTVVLRDGIIEAVGADVKAPDDAVVVDAKGKTLHAGFIDACSDIGLKSPEGAAAPQAGPPRAARAETPAGAGHPISRVHPEKRALDQLAPTDTDLERQRGFGFTAALAVPNEGIFRGTSALPGAAA